MAAAKGHKPPNAGKGRKKGVPNKVTGELKAMILGALDAMGGQSYLMEQARENPTAFLTLVGKTLPLIGPGDNGSHIFELKAPWLTPAIARRNSA